MLFRFLGIIDIGVWGMVKFYESLDNKTDYWHVLSLAISKAIVPSMHK
jgi:hypothetical protein